MARLYIVATPIGNLDDITLRAQKTLSKVRYIACEDTRRTGFLLSRLQLKNEEKPTLIRCDAHNAAGCIPRILSILETGDDVAYVSDAGTPGVSDPGGKLVDAVRSADFPVEPIPGVSAVTSLLSVSGISSSGWFFEGFLSNKSGRRTRRLEELFQRGDPFVLYESPHRIVKLLTALAEIEPEAPIIIGREMTKLHEEFLRGTAGILAEYAEQKRITSKGEFTVLVLPSKSS